MVDAVVPASALTLDLAQELDRLAPFGLGNPDVTLLVASCEAVEPGVVGDGKHLRFRVRQHGRDAGSAIAFGMGGQLDRLRAGWPLRRRLPAKENRWNGTVAPSSSCGACSTRLARYEELRGWLAELWRAGESAGHRGARGVRRARPRRRQVPVADSSSSRRRSGCSSSRPTWSSRAPRNQALLEAVQQRFRFAESSCASQTTPVRSMHRLT